MTRRRKCSHKHKAGTEEEKSKIAIASFFTFCCLIIVRITFRLVMSSSHAKDPSFLGERIPPEIESLSKNLKDVDQELFRKILKGKLSCSRDR